MSSEKYSTLQFESFHSNVDAEFWYELENRKLVKYKLDNSPKPLQASYICGGQYTELSSRFSLGRDGFQDTEPE